MTKKRFSSVARRVHTDAGFLQLSAPQPNARSLWLWLLTCPEQTNIPGLIRIGERGAAEACHNWPLEGFRKGFQEVSRNGLAVADWGARLVWVPKAIKYNPPANPNVIKSWSDNWDELPECSLKGQAWQALKLSLEQRRKGWGEVFANSCPNHSPNHPPNQEQEQESSLSKGAGPDLGPISDDEAGVLDTLRSLDDLAKHATLAFARELLSAAGRVKKQLGELLDQIRFVATEAQAARVAGELFDSSARLITLAGRQPDHLQRWKKTIKPEVAGTPIAKPGEVARRMRERKGLRS